VTGSTARPAYFDGMELGRNDLDCQKAFLDGLRQAYCTGLHTWGVAQGLDTERSSDGRVVSISPGLAITRTGRDVAVVEAVLLPAPDSGAGIYDLFLGARLLPADPSTASLTLGFKRQIQQPVAQFIPRGGGVPGDSVFLAAVTLDARGIIQSLDTSARRYCGRYAGSVGFRTPADGSMPARLEAVDLPGGTGLGVRADIVSFSAYVTLAGGLSLSGGPRLAAFDIAGDGALASIEDTDGINVLDTDADGRSWIGPQPASDRTARLTVNGDIDLEAGYAVRFDPTADIRWNDGDQTVSMDGTSIVMQSQTGFQLSAGGGKTVWTVTPAGKTGINIPDPACALSVAGKIQSISGGFELADGHVQKTAANSTSVMVGAIIDWWRPAGTNWQLPPEYAICDGSTVSDPKSPLDGAVLPDLNELYMLGTGQFSQIGKLELDETHRHEIDSFPAHDHPILHTHSVYGPVDAAKDDGDSDASDDVCTRKEHTHTIDEQIEQCPQQNSARNTDIANPVATGAAATSPPSMALLKVMRIR